MPCKKLSHTNGVQNENKLNLQSERRNRYSECKACRGLLYRRFWNVLPSLPRMEQRVEVAASRRLEEEVESWEN
jgi:hypothetical protein